MTVQKKLQQHQSPREQNPIRERKRERGRKKTGNNQSLSLRIESHKQQHTIQLFVYMNNL